MYRKKENMDLLIKKGKMVISAIYDEAWGFSNELCYVRKDGKAYFINKAGQIMFEVI